MAVNQRLVAAVIAAAALSLTVTGLVIAATDSNPAGLAKDPLALNGYPPKSADVAVELTTNSGASLSANVEVNFKTGRVDAEVHFPFVITTIALDVRLIGRHVYVRPSDESSGPWLDLSVKSFPLFGISLELTKPDIYLVRGFEEHVTRSGYSTTYHFFKDEVALSPVIGSARANSTLGSVRFSITVGSQGEVSAGSITVQSKHGATTLSATVLSYNQPAPVAAPTASDSKPLSDSEIEALLRSVNFNTLLFPTDLGALSQSSVS